MENQINIVGNLTDDPELRYTSSGKAVVNFTVAVSRRIRGENHTDGFFRCSAWQGLAENVAESLHKGDRVIVSGRLEQRSWTDNDENKRSSVEVRASHVAADLQFVTAALTKSVRRHSEDSEPEPAAV